MKCRKAYNSDLKVLKELWYECFLEHDSKESIDYYFKSSFDLDNTFVLEVDNKIVTSLQLNQHKLNYNNKIIEVSFVVGVATFKNERKKGYMRVLLEFAIEYAKKVYKQEIMILQAYNWDVYRPFGFFEAYYKSVSNITIESLKHYNTEILLKPESATLKKIYDSYTSNLNGYKLRDLNYFDKIKEMLQIDNVQITCTKKAYLFYSISNNTIEVSECAFESIDDLMVLIKSVLLKENITKIKILSDCKNFNYKNKELFMMIKILNSKEMDIDYNEMYISEWI